MRRAARARTLSRATRPLAAVVAVGLGLTLGLTACTAPPTPTAVASATATSSDAPTSAATATATGSRVWPDFDGDGSADLAVGVDGRVSVRYANGRNADATPSDLGTGDATTATFPRALLARDLNGDGFTDLVVSDTGEDRGFTLWWIFGSASGLDLHGAVATTSTDYPGAGAALALVTTPDPVLLVGPSVTSDLATVLAYPLGADGRPSGDPQSLRAEDLGLPALNEGSGFGTTLAASGSLLAIGAPQADVGRVGEAGAVYTVDFSQQPLRARRITQDSAGVADNAQAGDRFGAALAMDARYLVVGVPGDDRTDERGHNRARTGMVQPFRIVGSELQPDRAIDQLYLPGNVEAGDGFGSAVSMIHPCTDTDGVLIGASDEAIGTTEWAGSVWIAPLGDDARCGDTQLWGGHGLGSKPKKRALLGASVSVLRTNVGGDTLVIGAPGDIEAGVKGRVLTLDYPYEDAPVMALTGLQVMIGDMSIALSSPEG